MKFKSYSVNKEIPNILEIPKIYNSVHENPSPVPSLSQKYQNETLQNISKTHFNINLSSKSTSCKQFLSLGVSYKSFAHICSPAPLISSSYLIFNRPNIISCEVHVYLSFAFAVFGDRTFQNISRRSTRLNCCTERQTTLYLRVLYLEPKMLPNTVIQ